MAEKKSMCATVCSSTRSQAGHGPCAGPDLMDLVLIIWIVLPHTGSWHGVPLVARPSTYAVTLPIY